MKRYHNYVLWRVTNHYAADAEETIQLSLRPVEEDCRFNHYDNIPLQVHICKSCGVVQFSLSEKDLNLLEEP